MPTLTMNKNSSSREAKETNDLGTPDLIRHKKWVMTIIENKKVGIRYPVKESSRTNKSKYYCFHKSHNHNTNYCI